jgi:hypothetical protein
MAQRQKPTEIVDDLPDDGYVSEEDEDYDPLADAPAEAQVDQAQQHTQQPTRLESLLSENRRKRRKSAAAERLQQLGTVSGSTRANVALALRGQWPSKSTNSVEQQLAILQAGRERKRHAEASGESNSDEERCKFVGAAKFAVSDATRALETTGVSAGGDSGRTLKVAEKQEHAGETVEVKKEVPEGSKAAKAYEEKERQREATKGFDAVLALINSKKKLSTLEKSKLDWGSWKTQQGKDEQADLEKHVNSGGTHLERTEFLHRAEWAEYAKERDARLAADPRTRVRA